MHACTGAGLDNRMPACGSRSPNLPGPLPPPQGAAAAQAAVRQAADSGPPFGAQWAADTNAAAAYLAPNGNDIYTAMAATAGGAGAPAHRMLAAREGAARRDGPTVFARGAIGGPRSGGAANLGAVRRLAGADAAADVWTNMVCAWEGVQTKQRHAFGAAWACAHAPMRLRMHAMHMAAARMTQTAASSSAGTPVDPGPDLRAQAATHGRLTPTLAAAAPPSTAAAALTPPPSPAGRRSRARRGAHGCRLGEPLWRAVGGGHERALRLPSALWE